MGWTTKWIDLVATPQRLGKLNLFGLIPQTQSRLAKLLNKRRNCPFEASPSEAARGGTHALCSTPSNIG